MATTVTLNSNAVVTAEEAFEFVFAEQADRSDEDKDVVLKIVNAVSEAIEKYIQKYVIKRTNIVEFHDGGDEEIFLKNYPIKGITYVKENGSQLTAPSSQGAGDGDFDYYADMGIIYKQTGAFYSGRQKVEVKYDAGIAEDVSGVPADIKQAALIWIRDIYKSGPENYSTIITEGSTVRPSEMPAKTKQLLDPYCKVVVR